MTRIFFKPVEIPSDYSDHYNRLPPIESRGTEEVNKEIIKLNDFLQKNPNYFDKSNDNLENLSIWVKHQHGKIQPGTIMVESANAQSDGSTMWITTAERIEEINPNNYLQATKWTYKDNSLVPLEFSRVSQSEHESINTNTENFEKLGQLINQLDLGHIFGVSYCTKRPLESMIYSEHTYVDKKTRTYKNIVVLKPISDDRKSITVEYGFSDGTLGLPMQACFKLQECDTTRSGKHFTKWAHYCD